MTTEAVTVVESDPLETRIARLGEALLQRIIGFIQTADIAVVDEPSLRDAASLRKAIGALDEEACAYFAPEKQRYYALHKAACAREAEVRSHLAALDIKVKAAIRTFNDAETARREAAEQAERARLQALAQDRATAEAAAHESAGDGALAASVLAEAIAAPAPVVVLPNVTQGVVTFTRVWKWRYPGGTDDARTSPPAVVQRTLALIPREFLKVDEAKLGTYARAMKGGATVPGIEFYHVDEPRR